MHRSHFNHKQGKGCEGRRSHLRANWCHAWKHVALFINCPTWLLSNPACLCQKICGSKQSISGRQFGHLLEATGFFGLLLIYCRIINGTSTSTSRSAWCTSGIRLQAPPKNLGLAFWRRLYAHLGLKPPSGRRRTNSPWCTFPWIRCCRLRIYILPSSSHLPSSFQWGILATWSKLSTLGCPSMLWELGCPGPIQATSN